MQELQIFDNKEFGRVRAMTIDGQPYFAGKDVAAILGYANPSKALMDHVGDEDKLNNESLSSLGQRGGWLINESGLYSLVLLSKMPRAKQFKRWVTAEILPTIRKTGGYVASEDTFLETYMPYATEETKALFKTQLQHIRQLNQKIKADAPKVLFADAVSASQTSILVGDLAKLLKQNGVNIGSRRLFEWLRQNGYLMRKGEARNMPTQRSMEAGLFEVKETTITNGDGSIRITRTTKVTGKGQQFFVNKFLRERAG
ncbi:phage antirepressor KilAC domain-containing protein [Christensenellaceae bacterium 44-20]